MQKIEINLMKREKNSMIRGRIHTDLALEAKERYEEFKQQFPQICQRVKLRNIASYLGITLPTLSRLRAKK